MLCCRFWRIKLNILYPRSVIQFFRGVELNWLGDTTCISLSFPFFLLLALAFVRDVFTIFIVFGVTEGPSE